MLGGFWSTYWYNGETYGSELARGLDVLSLATTDQMSENEIAAAREVEVRRLNVQNQEKYRWKPRFAVVRSYVDQLERSGALDGRALRAVNRLINLAERFNDRGLVTVARAALRTLARQLRGEELQELRDAVRDLARSLRR